jgi:serine/threonine protein kinase
MNLFRVIFMSLFIPVWIWFWLIYSLGDFGRLITHGLAACIYLVWVGWYSLTDRQRGKRLLREAQREVQGAGSAFYSFTGRFLRWLGFGGLLERVERGLVASTRPTMPMETQTAEAVKHYKFQENYRVLGSLPGGGSTAKLFIVEPTEPRPDWPGKRFVLKYFDLRSGSRLDETMRESRSLQSARRIGAVLDYHFDEQAFYYVMPFYEGPTLAASVQARFADLEPDQWLAEPDARRLLGWFRSLLRQLADFHRAGVVHKDVKPDNVIVVGDDVRLIDVGLLTEITSTFTLTTHGTEYYRDPEMVRLALSGAKVYEVDARRFDIYSAGALLYHMLEGSFPACGPLSQFTRPVPFALQWMSAQAMADASKRYSSIDQLLDDLEAFLRRSKRGRMDEVKPADLPSFDGQAQAEAYPPPPPPAPTPLPIYGQSTRPVRYPRWHRRNRPRRRRFLRSALFLILMVVLLAALVNAISRPPGTGTMSIVQDTVPEPPMLRVPAKLLTLQSALNQPIRSWLSQIEAAHEAASPGEDFDATGVPILVTANYLDTPGAFDAEATRLVCEHLDLDYWFIPVEGLPIDPQTLKRAASVNHLTDELGEELRRAADLSESPMLLYVRLTGDESAQVALVSELARDETPIEWQLYTSPSPWDEAAGASAYPEGG